ncbi:MAG: BNR-4 repeat-containing protein [Candidatus Hydrogenedentes bacterium]|nr:BNR-4 repeat-containing protein [Candidatus Hydrogenedentota bacterium]
MGTTQRMGGLLAGLSMTLLAGSSDAAPAPGPAEGGTDVRFGGCGGVYFLAEPGEFWVEIEKADLNRSNQNTHLRAILFGPDRRVIDEQWLPDDGQGKGSGPGPVQRVRLAATVARPGIYGLNVTVTEDRYGTGIAWGFRTNCGRYLVETSRGHRDAPHEEPLVLLSPDAPGDVCFLPQPGEFAMEVTGLPQGVAAPAVFDAHGTEIAALAVDADGTASHTFSPRAEPDAIPWRLHLPAFQATVHIDGVTRWADAPDGFADLSLWTPRLESWFAFHENRWLLTPYSRIVYAEPGAEGAIEFRVHNNGTDAKRVGLSIEFPGDADWPVELSAREVALAPGQSEPVAVRYRVPEGEDARICHLRATPLDDSGVSTYSTLELRRGAAPASRPLAMPIVLEPYRHENEQFGYLPDYPVSPQPYFDLDNRPVMCANGVTALRDGAWQNTAVSALPDGTTGRFEPRVSKVAFDRTNGMCLIADQGGTNAYLYSQDGGRTFAAYPIPGGRSFDIEQFSGHNVPDGPPPFVRIIRTAKDPKLMWRSLCDLALFVPTRDEKGAIDLGEPILLSKKCLGISLHSGAPSSIVSRGPKVHVAWAEATEPDEKVPGVPTFVATYDRETGAVDAPALVGYGPPPNDVHNTPCITIDSKGFLHVLVGTHGRTFKYARSLEPNTAAGGWTEPEDMGPDLRQTYIGMVCDRDDTLHVVFRLWRADTGRFPASTHAVLAYMRKRPGEPWSEPRPLVLPAFSEYSVFYHRLTIDRAGRLFLSYDYWTTFWFYRTDHFGSRRALIMSPDGGDTWKLVESADFAD